MIFETLHASAERGELLLVDGGMTHWHLRRDGQLTIREMLVTRPNEGIGSAMLATLTWTPGADTIFLKCPADLPANRWWQSSGFVHEGTETTKTGKVLNRWRLYLHRMAP